MLRGTNESNKLLETPPVYGAKTEGAFPGLEQPFSTEEHPVGLLFYRLKQSFFYPYSLLQTMRYEEGKITLAFATADVSIEGRGLHQLYTLLAAQRVSRIVEQGQRYAGVSEATLHIRKIDEIPREK